MNFEKHFQNVQDKLFDTRVDLHKSLVETDKFLRVMAGITGNGVEIYSFILVKIDSYGF